MHQRAEGADHQSGADQQDKRKPHLHNHQGLARAVPLAALAQCAASFAKSAGRSCTGKLRNWDGSDEQARKQREARGEKEDGNIDADLVDARQAGRRHRHQYAQSAKGQSQSNARARMPRTTLSNSRSAAIRPHRAPRAERIASSWRRPSTRTSNRFATLAHATSRTMAMEPISTHRTLPTSPITSCFSGRRLGLDVGLFKQRGAEAVGRRETAEGNGQQPGHVGAGLLHRDPRLQPCQCALY